MKTASSSTAMMSGFHMPYLASSQRDHATSWVGRVSFLSGRQSAPSIGTSSMASATAAIPPPATSTPTLRTVRLFQVSRQHTDRDAVDHGSSIELLLTGSDNPTIRQP